MVLVYKARAANVCSWQPITTVQTLAQSFGRMAKLLLPPNVPSLSASVSLLQLPVALPPLIRLARPGGRCWKLPKNQRNFRYDFVEHENCCLLYENRMLFRGSGMFKKFWVENDSLYRIWGWNWLLKALSLVFWTLRG